MIAKHRTLSIRTQCTMLAVPRSRLYYEPEPALGEDLVLKRLLDEAYMRHPFYGTRRMVVYLRHEGWQVNRKRVRRLMHEMGIEAIAPGPNTSRRNKCHAVYPYLLRGLEIHRPNQVWSTDITYIPLSHGFAYLVAVIDWYSRKVLAWRVSNTLDAGFCLDCVNQALSDFGKPEIFNTDQGCQFTSEAFISLLKKNDIAISMDGRGRALDNIFIERLWRSVKYEDVYIKGYTTITQLLVGLTEYFAFYNRERGHQSLAYETPDNVYARGIGGGARVLNPFAAPSVSRASLRSTRETLGANSETYDVENIQAIQTTEIVCI